MSPTSLEAVMTNSAPSHSDCSLYNAHVRHARQLHDALMIVRVVLDARVPEFMAGQYATLGLGEWEPRVDDVGSHSPLESATGQLIRRAYSISCPLLDA